jgi:hypothetical protein
MRVTSVCKLVWMSTQKSVLQLVWCSFSPLWIWCCESSPKFQVYFLVSGQSDSSREILFRRSEFTGWALSSWVFLALWFSSLLLPVSVLLWVKRSPNLANSAGQIRFPSWVLIHRHPASGFHFHVHRVFSAQSDSRGWFCVVQFVLTSEGCCRWIPGLFLAIGSNAWVFLSSQNVWGCFFDRGRKVFDEMPMRSGIAFWSVLCCHRIPCDFA